MIEETKPNSTFKPYKEKEYRDYLIWKSLPSFLFKLDKERVNLMDLPMEIVELLEYKTRKEFAEHFGIDRTNLWLWDNEPIPDKYKDLDWKNWAKKLTKNIIGALYRQALIEGDAARIKLWLQVIEGWREAQELELTDKRKLSDIEKAMKESSKEPDKEPEKESDEVPEQQTIS